jgi:hypothetical protein
MPFIIFATLLLLYSLGSGPLVQHLSSFILEIDLALQI